jgi:transcriptional regulator with XRE-family HTH domain
MYSDLVATSIAKVIGANARDLRKKAGVNLDQFALAARFCGLPWSTGRVGDFESGRVLPNLEVVYAVALALQQVTGQPVTLAKLLASDQPVQINDKLTVDMSTLADAVRGEPVRGETESYRKLSEAVEGFTVKQAVPVFLKAFREADERVCRQLGVTRERGAAAMYKKWGQTFTDKRDELAQQDADPANAQRLGQISRQLKAELKKAIR